MEKKLTVKERHKIYKKVYKIVNSSEWEKDRFICNHIERESKIVKECVFDIFQEFRLFAPLNYKFQKYSDPFCLGKYNPEIGEDNVYNEQSFTPIQQTILAFCIVMTE